jgi:tRNA(fMet)-specific endonuclease VapC
VIRKYRLLDTNIASYLIKRRYPSVRARYLEFDQSEVGMSVVSKAEILYGLRLLESEHHLHAASERFFSDIAILPWVEAAAAPYAEFKHRLERAGKVIGAMDQMIAAHAVAIGAILVTNNVRHFEWLAPDVEIENWVDTSG